MQKNYLYKTEDIVKILLVEDIETRKDDMYLYYRYCKRVLACENLKTIEQIREFNNLFIELFLSVKVRKYKGISAFESVRRCRQKIQAMHPELRHKETDIKRTESIQHYREYALNLGGTNEA